MNDSIHLVYMSANKEIHIYSFSHFRKDEYYLTGFCLQKNRLITLRLDRVISEFNSLELAENYLKNILPDVVNHFKILIDNQSPIINSKRTYSSDNSICICFTGFKSERKQELIELANKNNLRVVQSVSSAVDFLIFDKSSKTVGPKKLETAAKFGVKIINDDDFLYMLDTGYIPD
ncbi:hypothetical protein OF381_10355 [Mannheimia haemolytica]